MSGTGATPPTGAPDVASPSGTGDTAAALDEAGRALFRLGRLFGRRPLPERLAEPGGRAAELSRILVAEAIAAGPVVPGEDVTVGLVAARLAVDPSTASRLVAEAIRAGYVAGTASPADARRRRLDLTAAGHGLVADARRYQRAVFERLTRDWTDEERLAFARLLVRFAAAVGEELEVDS
ncbi:MAG TPA: MarR family winged helix-turn-helix transcriptional regulator [Thermomicrobiales bacterium]|nr:MarR family winged helix-turn-helix transcriptional regulator [Thermomicrobiales bacterium]